MCSDEYGGVDPTGMSGGLVLAGELVNDSLKDVKFKIKEIGSNFSENGKNIVGLNFIDSRILDGLRGINLAHIKQNRGTFLEIL